MRAAMSKVVKDIISSNDENAKRELRKLISSSCSVGESRTIYVAGKSYRTTVIPADRKKGSDANHKR